MNSEGQPGARAIKLRSARCLSAHWDCGELRIVNYLTRERFAANPVVLELVRFFYSPRTLLDTMAEFNSFTRESVGRTILKMIEAQLLLECDSPESARDELLDSHWNSWLPEAGFHFLTKDAPYIAGDATREQKLQSLPDTLQPPFFKKTDARVSISLPVDSGEKDDFFQTLHARRTHRKFSAGQVSLDSVAKLLHATWGVQGYVESKYFGSLPLKTSPSGGARNPVEVYLMALRISGFDAGLYHYDAEAHALASISSRATAQQARAFCADQPFVAEAAALFIMTGVFERTMWKYPHPRAYRVVLLDAGHLAQTFCLTATRMGLAPFCTAALKDSLIETDLGIDGISESVLYVTGVGGLPGR